MQSNRPSNLKWAGVVAENPQLSVRQVWTAIDLGSAGTAVIVDEEFIVRGVVTDGDIRRAILNGMNLEDQAGEVIRRRPVTVPIGTPKSAILDMLTAFEVNVIPEVDGIGRLVDVHLLKTIVGREEIPHPCLILAGGRGTRLGSLTDDKPKPMMKIAGRPLLERIILNLRGQGFYRFFLSVSYLGEQIKDHFGDGSSFDCSIEYVEDPEDMALGTAGPIGQVWEAIGGSGFPLLVMNGDLLTEIDAASLVAAHKSDGADLTVAVKNVSYPLQYGVVQRDGNWTITQIDEKPIVNHEVIAGVYAVSQSLGSLTTPIGHKSMVVLIEEALQKGMRVQAWALDTEWRDIGSPDDLRKARGE